MMRRSWDEIYRLIDICRALRPSLPPQVLPVMDGAIQTAYVDPTVFLGKLRLYSLPCQNLLSGDEKAHLVAMRSSALENTAIVAQTLKDIIGTVVRGLTTTHLPNVQLEAGFKYLSMFNSSMDDWIGAMRQQSRDWDVMWAHYQERQHQIDRMRLDVLSGTPFIKAYIAP